MNEPPIIETLSIRIDEDENPETWFEQLSFSDEVPMLIIPYS